jgi:hypothetical protein
MTDPPWLFEYLKLRTERLFCYHLIYTSPLDVLWKEKPSRTIEDISKEKYFLKFEKCGMYAGKITLKDWTKALNPNSPPSCRPKAND